MSESCNLDALESLVREELPADEAARVQTHAAGCPSCHKELMWLRVEQDLGARRRALQGPVPGHLWPAILERTQRRRLRDYLPAAWLGYAAAAASMLVGAFAVRHAMIGTHAHVGALPITVRGERAAREPQTAKLSVTRPVRLRLSTAAADVDVSVGEAGVVTLTISDSDVRRVALRATDDGGVEPVFDGGQVLQEGHLSLSLPAGSALDVRTASGEIEVHGVGGAASLRSASGDVTVEGPRELLVETRSGDVQVEGALGPVTAHTVSGEVQVRDATGAAARLVAHTVSGGVDFGGACGAECRIEVRTVSGDVQLRLSRSSTFALRYQSLSGDLRNSLGLSQKSTDNGLGLWQLGDGAGRIDCTTTSGDLSIDAD